MTREEFLESFKNLLQTDENIAFETKLSEIEEWDSLAMITTAAFIDEKFSKKVSVLDIKNSHNIEEIYNLIER